MEGSIELESPWDGWRFVSYPHVSGEPPILHPRHKRVEGSSRVGFVDTSTGGILCRLEERLMPPRRSTREARLDALRLVDEGRPVAEVARNRGIHVNTLDGRAEQALSAYAVDDASCTDART